MSVVQSTGYSGTKNLEASVSLLYNVGNACAGNEVIYLQCGVFRISYVTINNAI